MTPAATDSSAPAQLCRWQKRWLRGEGSRESRRDPRGAARTLQHPPASRAVGTGPPSVSLPCSLPAGTEHSSERRPPEDAGGPAGQRGRGARGGLPGPGPGGQAGGGAGGAGAARPAIAAGPQGPLQKLLLENLHLLLVLPGLAPPGRPPANTLPSPRLPRPPSSLPFLLHP